MEDEHELAHRIRFLVRAVQGVNVHTPERNQHHRDAKNMQDLVECVRHKDSGQLGEMSVLETTNRSTTKVFVRPTNQFDGDSSL